MTALQHAVVPSPRVERDPELSGARGRQVLRALRTVLRSGGLIFHFQPEVDLHTGRFGAVETLARCPDSPVGPLMPDEFIPLAERGRLIESIGDAALDAALDFSTALLVDADHPPLLVAVNVSPHQLLAPGFVGSFVSTLRAQGVDPSRLCVEITETALIGDVTRVVRALQELREADVRLAIDDFGSGHASLTYLARFPVHTVKVDKSFVDGLGSDERSTCIVESVISMGHALGMQVVAEGVETLQQLEILLEHGCDIAQGHLFATAMDADTALLTLASTAPWPVELAGRRTKQAEQRQQVVIDPARRFRLLADVARDITAARTLDAVLRTSFAALRRLLPFSGGSIQLVDGGELYLAATDPPATTAALGARIPLGQGVGGRLAQTGEPRYIADITLDADVSAARRKASVSGGVRSWYGVPLVASGRVIGILQIDSTSVDAFSLDDQTLVLAFAPIVAAAVGGVPVDLRSHSPVA